MKTLSEKVVMNIPKAFGSGQCKQHWISRSIFEHKVYPKCRKCRDRYVPIVEGDKVCFRCKNK